MSGRAARAVRGRRFRVAAGAMLALAALAGAGEARAQAPVDECAVRGSSILADLSTHSVTVDAKFFGTEVIVFGAIDCAGDVVVAVRGPRRTITVREKEKVAGIWINGRSVTFVDAPVLYAVGATAPIDEILPPRVRQARGIGLSDLYLPLDGAPPEDLQNFRDAMVRYQELRGFYSRSPVPVDMTGGKLFRANIWFPSSVPTGQYIADVFLVHKGTVVGAHSLALRVYRGGLEARLFDFAHEEPALYGAGAVSIATLVGWIVGALFRRP